ncbi:uncharacterized protein [Epargyreus clarus]|uniref:uncharacterized protein n=1 Tax=Epargyreus clarus TaxID=520877 RepID=UPI003C2F1AD0
MLAAVTFLFVFPTLLLSSGEGNIHLLEDEVATALRACSYNESEVPKRNNGNNRQRRSDDYNSQYGYQVPRIDKAKQNNDLNIYDHERRNSSEIYVLNGTENDIPRVGSNMSVKYVRSATIPNGSTYNNNGNWTRNKRSNSLIDKSDQDQCLSQCVFANLQVVDARGIPREAELWNKVQTALTSQQSRTVLKDQIRACFQELQTETEDNGCSYSNKLERCLMLRFSDRKINL